MAASVVRGVGHSGSGEPVAGGCTRASLPQRADVALRLTSQTVSYSIDVFVIILKPVLIRNTLKPTSIRIYF